MYTNCRAYFFKVPTYCAGKKNEMDKEMCGWDTEESNFESKLKIPNTADLNFELIQMIERHFNSDQNGKNIKNQVARLTEAIQISLEKDSEKNSTLNNDDKTLKIFVAPEFYFRYRGPDGNQVEYSGKEFNMLYNFFSEYFDNLSTIYPGYTNICNWIFLCGTCVYDINSVYSSKFKPRVNVMPVFTINQEKKINKRIIRKIYTSKIDGISGYVDFNTLEPFSETRRNPLIGIDHYFEKFNLFIEICLEASMGLFSAVTSAVPWPLNVNFNVISAAGMPLDNINKECKKCIIRNDGAATSSEMLSFVDLFKKISKKATKIKECELDWSYKKEIYGIPFDGILFDKQMINPDSIDPETTPFKPAVYTVD